VSSQRPRFLVTEFSYRPRPTDSHARTVFDYALASRLSRLNARDTVVYLCDSDATVASMQNMIMLRKTRPGASPRIEYQIVNPRMTPPPNLPDFGEGRSSPFALGWDAPDHWQRMAMTDRWARIDAALAIGAAQTDDGYLIMPAQDAVWGAGLLEHLVTLSRRFAKNGLPAAVSPVTYWQHSGVPDARIPRDIIDLLNTIFARDSLFWWKVTTDQVQAFWGKMSVIPFGMCAVIRQHAAMTTLEDDLIIDSTIRRLGFGVRAVWSWDRRRYRQTLPVYNEADIRRVIARTLHYSLNATNSRDTIGGSTLNHPLDALGRLRTVLSPRFRRYNPRAERLIQACADEIRARVRQHNASWVDWGAYRVVVHIGDPDVEVWRRVSSTAD